VIPLRIKMSAGRSVSSNNDLIDCPTKQWFSCYRLCYTPDRMAYMFARNYTVYMNTVCCSVCSRGESALVDKIYFPHKFNPLGRPEVMWAECVERMGLI
jgi:hypothetical protein